MELSPGTEFAGHRIDAVAGRGGMGVVYRATHLALDRVVALKLIASALSGDESFRARFKQESMTAASIDHPNVIPIYDAGEADGQLYITMRFVDGTDLRSALDQRGALPPDDATRIVSDIAAALDAAHARGLVHRDVKPANVLISADGKRAYLTDFGLTKHAASTSGVTQTGMFVGTLDYIAPEQLAGKGVDARADVYSLGCVLFEALTGQVPYPREEEPAKMWAHMGEPPPPVSSVRPDLPAQFDEVVTRAMAKDPDERFPSAGDLGRAARAAAEARATPHPERSVATGQAAPSGAAPPPVVSIPQDAPTAMPTVTPVPPPPPTGPPIVFPPPPAGGWPQPSPPAPVPSQPVAPPPPPASPRAVAVRRRRLVAAGAILGVVALIVVGLALALGGGGGGSSKNPDPAVYRSAATKAAGDFESASTVAGAHLRAAQNPLDFSAGANEFRRAVSVFIGRLQRLAAPPAARAPQARLITILRRLAGDVGAISDAVNAGDRARVLSLAAPIQRDQREVKTAATQLETAAGG